MTGEASCCRWDPHTVAGGLSRRGVQIFLPFRRLRSSGAGFGMGQSSSVIASVGRCRLSLQCFGFL